MMNTPTAPEQPDIPEPPMSEEPKDMAGVVERLRDDLAMAALPLVWHLGRDAGSAHDCRYLTREENIAANAADAYAVADAMLKARAISPTAGGQGK